MHRVTGKLLLVPLVLLLLSGSCSGQFWDSEFVNTLFSFMRYKGIFVSIFRHATQKNHFFFTPLAVLQKDTGHIYYNYLKDVHEVNFNVVMATDELEQQLMDHLRNTKNVTKASVQPLPMETVRFTYASPLRRASTKLDLETNPVPNNHLPRSLKLRFYSFTNGQAKAFQRAVSDNPEMLDQLVLEYTITSKKTARKQVEIRAQYIAQAELFSKLVTMSEPGTIRYLNAEDVNKLAMQSSTVIKAKVIRSREYIEGPDELRLTQVVLQQLQQEPVQMQQLSAESRKSVFWDPIYARPDEVTHMLNKIYEKESRSSSRLKVKRDAKDLIESSKKDSTVCYLFKCSGSSLASGRRLNTSQSLTEKEMNEFLKERNIEVEMKGRMFVVKNMRLYRVNTAHFTADRTIATSSVQVSKKKEVHSLKLKTDSELKEEEVALAPATCGNAAYKYKGCYGDSINTRDLNGYSFHSQEMQPAQCYNACRQRSFKFFGVQRGDLCSCGNSYGNYGLRADTECNIVCNGDRQQRCGGVMHNSVFEILAQASVDGHKIETEAKKGEKEEKGEEQQQQQQQQQQHSQAAVNVLNSKSFKYTGCYAMKAAAVGGHQLSAIDVSSSSSQSVQKCHSECRLTSSWFALSAGSKCSCLQSVLGLQQLQDAQCSSRCSGNQHQVCGDDSAASVYSITTGWHMVSPPSTLTTLTKKSAMSVDEEGAALHKELGCYSAKLRNFVSRLVPGNSEISFSMTIGNCYRYCSNFKKPYHYMALLDGLECRCSNELRDASDRAEDSKCGVPCFGDSSQHCGSRHHLRVFSITAADDAATEHSFNTIPKSPIPAARSALDYQQLVGCVAAHDIMYPPATLEVESLQVASCANFCRKEINSKGYFALRNNYYCACYTKEVNFVNNAQCGMRFFKFI